MPDDLATPAAPPAQPSPPAAEPTPSAPTQGGVLRILSGLLSVGGVLAFFYGYLATKYYAAHPPQALVAAGVALLVLSLLFLVWRWKENRKHWVAGALLFLLIVALSLERKQVPITVVAVLLLLLVLLTRPKNTATAPTAT